MRNPAVIMSLFFFASANFTHAIFYDDFSSNNLQNWTITNDLGPGPHRGNTHDLDGGILTLRPSGIPVWGRSFYTSNTINWGTVSAANPIRVFVELPANPLFSNETSLHEGFRLIITDGINNAFLGIDFRGTDTPTRGNDWRWKVAASEMTPSEQWLADYPAYLFGVARYVALEYDGSTFSLGVYDSNWRIVSIPEPILQPTWRLGPSGKIAFAYNSGPNTFADDAYIKLNRVGLKRR